MQRKGYAYRGVPVIYGDLVGPYDSFLGNEDSTFDYRAGMAQLDADFLFSKNWSAELAASYMHTTQGYKIWAWGTSKAPPWTLDDMYNTDQGMPIYYTGEGSEDIVGWRAIAVGQYRTGWWGHKILFGTDGQEPRRPTVYRSQVRNQAAPGRSPRTSATVPPGGCAAG